MIYYVSTKGNDKGTGSIDRPFRTINRAASIAVAGDVVRVYGGTYRECVDPKNSGLDDSSRIIYEAVDGERPIIKGSETVTDWEKVGERVWKKVLDNSLFGDFNPFYEKLFGDWLVLPSDYDVHLGDVYLNGISMYEARSLEELKEAKIRYELHHHVWTSEKIRYPEQTVYQWYAEVDAETTTLYCNFGEYDPNTQSVEISVRGACFFPSKTQVNYITVRGFEMANAATQWAPPTAEQSGLIGPNWSRGWIIENNIIHDVKCSAVSLGKERSTGHNLHRRFMRKPGYQYQQEAVYLALRYGWSQETVGSHIVRNNVIYNCGQNAIVGHMGCAFSRIEHNHIYNVNFKQEFWGHEVAGIKFHAAIDTVIENNNIHNSSLGIWLDWQAQGTRVTKNLFYANERDFMLEVSHGPCLIDNNLFLSDYTIQETAQGSAYVHNIIAGPMRNYATLDRSTPYHFAHSTSLAGSAVTFGGDMRMLNNLIIGKAPETDVLIYPGAILDVYSTSDEYMPKLREFPRDNDEQKYFEVQQPVWVEENAYSGYARPFRAEVSPILTESMSLSLKEEGKEWILTLNIPEEVANANCKAVDTERLGTPRITEARFENPDGTPIAIDTDIFGNTRERTIPGPFAKLMAGKNVICVWKE